MFRKEKEKKNNKISIIRPDVPFLVVMIALLVGAAVGEASEGCVDVVEELARFEAVFIRVVVVVGKEVGFGV